ncbi:MAG: pyridoxamine 5'-phosphate oxidase family protein [Dehalococcoides mccartyi]|nr:MULTISPECIES: pyridoxamine 5'-phosphate oxidase family protein [Dehalococcoides]MDP4279493.1 pyridoxamine 5'-phosphate oxidase family protein [Dehalococcoides mccartyi]MEA4879732.1 pyridoxamine 5'-phosphate oxidase family protein [Dehalococcoides mccartyi]WRO08017.1 pyridoxamine 5'-phosphate oxidase family protein [Dehalococcoides mccartyi]
MSQEVINLFQDPSVPKMVATIDKKGELNVTPKTSMTAVDAETLAFADLYGRTTRTFKNLEETKKVAIVAVKVPVAPPFTTYQVKGTFLKYHTSGPLFDQFAKALKEAMGVDITGVGTVKVDAVYSQAPQDKGKLIS